MNTPMGGLSFTIHALILLYGFVSGKVKNKTRK